MRLKQAFDGVIDLGSAVAEPLAHTAIFAGLMAGKVYAGKAVDKYRAETERQQGKIREKRREALKEMYKRQMGAEKKSSDAAYVDGVFTALNTLGVITE